MPINYPLLLLLLCVCSDMSFLLLSTAYRKGMEHWTLNTGHCGTEYTSSPAWLSSAESFLWNLGSVTNQSLDWKLSSNYKTSVSYSWSWFPAYPRCRVNGSTSHQFSFIYHLWLWLIHVYLPGDSASEVMHVLCKRLIAKSHGNRWRNTAYLKRWIIVIALF